MNKYCIFFLIVLCGAFLMACDGKESSDTKVVDYSLVENGIHVQSGLAYDENFEIVRALCTSCHSSKLITQNRATREGWRDMIVWMQKTQNLPDLGPNEPVVLDYLAKYYAPKEEGRRPLLDQEEIEWYYLEGE